MTVDIFIKSYPPDYPWLSYCLQSIQRFATGFRRVIVVTSEIQPPTGTAEEVHYVIEFGDKYLHQQLVKMHADCFTDAEFIAYLDSDTIFTRPVTPDDLIADCRRPIKYFTPYTSLEEKDRVWQKPTSSVLKEEVTNEFMRRHPFVVPRKLLQEFRTFFWRKHGMSIGEYIRGVNGREFSEFNALGAFLFKYHNDKIHWINTDERLDPAFVHQSWSWSGLTPEIRADLERALA